MGKWILHHFQFTAGQFRGVAVVLVDHLESGLASTTPNLPDCNETLTVFWSNCSEYPLSILWLAVSGLLPQEVDPVKVHDRV